MHRSMSWGFMDLCQFAHIFSNLIIFHLPSKSSLLWLSLPLFSILGQCLCISPKVLVPAFNFYAFFFKCLNFARRSFFTHTYLLSSSLDFLLIGMDQSWTSRGCFQALSFSFFIISCTMVNLFFDYFSPCLLSPVTTQHGYHSNTRIFCRFWDILDMWRCLYQKHLFWWDESSLLSVSLQFFFNFTFIFVLFLCKPKA